MLWTQIQVKCRWVCRIWARGWGWAFGGGKHLSHSHLRRRHSQGNANFSRQYSQEPTLYLLEPDLLACLFQSPKASLGDDHLSPNGTSVLHNNFRTFAHRKGCLEANIQRPCPEQDNNPRGPHTTHKKHFYYFGPFWPFSGGCIFVIFGRFGHFRAPVFLLFSAVLAIFRQLHFYCFRIRILLLRLQPPKAVKSSLDRKQPISIKMGHKHGQHIGGIKMPHAQTMWVGECYGKQLCLVDNHRRAISADAKFGKLAQALSQGKPPLKAALCFLSNNPHKHRP